MTKSPTIGLFVMWPVLIASTQNKGQIGGSNDAPKLYKQFLCWHLTIVVRDGQTLPWKVGTPFL